MKNSDSDYKAEDEGSANEAVVQKKMATNKILFSLKMTKKEIIEKAVKNFLPEGVTIGEGSHLDQQDYEELEGVETAEEFSLNFKMFLGKIIHVTDGDTVKIAIKFGQKMTKFTFRLSGIDTPETRKG